MRHVFECHPTGFTVDLVVRSPTPSILHQVRYATVRSPPPVTVWVRVPDRKVSVYPVPECTKTNIWFPFAVWTPGRDGRVDTHSVTNICKGEIRPDVK